VPPPPAATPLSLHTALPISLPRRRRFRARSSARTRARDVSLYVGLDGHTQGRRALAPEPHLGGGDAPHRRARAPPLSHRRAALRSEEHTSELQSRFDLVCRL